MIEPRQETLSIRRHCELIDLARSTFCCLPGAESAANVQFMRLLDEQCLKTPFWGSRNMTTWLRQEGFAINRKRLRRLWIVLGLRRTHRCMHIKKSRKLGGSKNSCMNQPARRKNDV